MEQDSDENHKATNGAANTNEAVATGTVEIKIDAPIPSVSIDQNSEGVKSASTATEEKPAVSEMDNKKRKMPEDKRDWHIRREEDQNAKRGRNSNWRGDRGRGDRGRGDRSYSSRGSGKPIDYRKNVKSEYTRPESQDPEAIRKQVEFYFGDSNLPTDKFLLEQTGGPANRPVPIKVLHSFKRMKHFQPYSAVVAALRESNMLDVTDKEEVMRKEPLSEQLAADPNQNSRTLDDKTRSRTIYAKGFGEEGSRTQLDVEAFFAPYGPTNAIRLRRLHPERTFKGSAFVEFDSDETAQRFLALEPKPKWEGRDLLIMSKDAYIQSKIDGIREGKVIPRSWGSGRGRGDWRGRGRGERRGAQGGARGRDNGRRDDEGSKSDAEGSEDERDHGNDNEDRRVNATEDNEDQDATNTEKTNDADAPIVKAEESSNGKGKKRAMDDGGEAEVDARGTAEGAAEESDVKRAKLDLDTAATPT